jgi:type VI secretion system protein ImpA
MAMFVDIEKPISPEAPCGPDPDLDLEIQNFLAVAEGLLPMSYREFNRKSFDAKPSLKRLEELLAKSRDIRFLVLMAKFHILSDDLKGFAGCIASMRVLATAQWDHYHPGETAGGNPLRAAYLKSLDDLPTSVLPLQNATLINDKRLGAVSMRTLMVADRKLPARAEEAVHDASTIKDSFMRFEPIDSLVSLRALIIGISGDLDAIRQLFIVKAGYDIAPQFDGLPENAKAIGAYLADVINERVPSAEADADSLGAETSGEEGASSAASQADASAPADLRSFKEASNALEAILGYYAVSEPSSPARLLIKQAHQLVGKSFVEAMRVLAPSMADAATVKIGGEAPFALDFSQLSALVGEDQPMPGSEEEEARNFTASSRAEATSLMRKAEQFYRVAEPSSPIPLLVERARNFVAKDFTSLLKEMAKKDDNT